jgi:murein DD-endopeptidase MepM/ murein hydrolase activator NlpD
MVEFPVLFGHRPPLTLAARRYSIVVADRTNGTVRRFTLRAWAVAFATLCAFSLPVVIALGARWSAQAEIQDLKTTNDSLTLENESYRAATEQLSSQVSALQSAVDEIGGEATVDPAASRAMERLPALVKSRAMGGGTTAPVEQLVSAPFVQGDAVFGVLRDILSVIEERLHSVRDGVERRQMLASATPSIWPVAGWLSSAYGNRRDPFTGAADFHPGLDISADRGEPVLATADGIVTSSSMSGNYGNLVVIDHGFGITTKYGHLSRFAVMNGQQVRRGDVIGYVGSTGRSTSPHLHYEIWVNGQLTNPLRLLGPR